MISFSVASLFGTYGHLSFTYFSFGILWLAGDILGREPWYASAPAPTAVPQAVLRQAR